MSLNLLRENLKQAAHDYVQAHTEEMHQHHIDGISCPVELNQPLDILLKDALYDGTLEALMRAEIVKGNQSKAARILNINRTTLRSRLFRAGMLEPRRQRSKAEQAAYEARGKKPCEATRKGKLPRSQAA